MAENKRESTGRPRPKILRGARAQNITGRPMPKIVLEPEPALVAAELALVPAKPALVAAESALVATEPALLAPEPALVPTKPTLVAPGGSWRLPGGTQTRPDPPGSQKKWKIQFFLFGPGPGQPPVLFSAALYVN